MRGMTGLWQNLAKQWRRRPATDARSLADLPCSVCGASASSWEFVTVMKAAGTVIEGRPVCDLHAESRRRATG